MSSTCMSRHHDCSHKVNSLCHILCLGQFSAADQRTTKDPHTSVEPMFKVHTQIINIPYAAVSNCAFISGYL